MAQSEDTELRDLVVEALEKNGSLAKIRALLRANVFLAFEDGYDNLIQNVSLDNILKTPEGLLSLSVIHEFLEFCNLKNTLFVYKSETRQEKAYKYVGSKVLHENFDFKYDNTKEPVLVSMVKYIKKSLQRIYTDRNTIHHNLNKQNVNNRDDQNCTYIVHDDSSTTTSHTHSDNSSDEKTKLQLRLHSDNSDTDTSSDSARDKSSSEYIPNEHILQKQNNFDHKIDITASDTQLKLEPDNRTEIPGPFYLKDLKNHHNTSSESTSYADLKPFNASEEKLLNTTGIPITAQNILIHKSNNVSNDTKLDTANSIPTKEIKSSSNTLSSISTLSVKEDVRTHNDNQLTKKSSETSIKSDSETVEYSYDFTISGASKNKDNDIQVTSPQSIEEQIVSLDSHSKNSSLDSPHENSVSTRSSISISDVQDLISEKSIYLAPNVVEDSNNRLHIQNFNKPSEVVKSPSNDSGDFSESIPSLSNLSLDIHSD